MADCLRLLVQVCATTTLALTVACGGAATTSSEGSSTTGGSGTGGGGSTGGAGSGGTITGECQVASDCVAVVSTAAPCYTPECARPVAASKADLANESCLVPWEKRYEPDVPTYCTRTGPGRCVPSCTRPPSCAIPVCDNGTCQLQLGFTDAECGVTPDCPLLNDMRQKALDAARACDPTLDSIQCSGTDSVLDECGCPQLVNEAHPELVQDAISRRDQWSADCPPPPCSLGACAVPTSGSCGADGICAAN